MEESKTVSLAHLDSMDGHLVLENNKLSISDKRVSTNPDFVVDMEEIAIIVMNAEIPTMYWKELKRDLPQNQTIKILRWPGENGTESGLDLAVPEERHMIFETITKIRQSLLQSASSTTTSTSHIVTSITAPVEQE
ncbi:4826_t:CDS:2 [Entrophospora sp. SA101]|nr:2379_t:CDS:2 [Entrophospora sp. SA101]CAJ0755196.1 4826_t:CDS:2 [Entrophospora sp. SA101]CAJ0915320.1 5248_t:CDS:2 [Entrophospora sp. SA101]